VFTLPGGVETSGSVALIYCEFAPELDEPVGRVVEDAEDRISSPESEQQGSSET
jgi:hypothetical protein